MIHAPAILCIVALLVLLGAIQQEHKRLEGISKAVASSGFVLYAVTSGALMAGATGALVLLGLCLSMVGDLALVSRSKKWFLIGLVAFLLAHVAYIGAFLSLGIDTKVGAIALVPLGLAAGGVRVWLGDRPGKLTRAVIAYILVITAMVGCAIAALGASTTVWPLLVAAVVFYLSDLCVARDRFVAPGPVNRFIGLPLYYAAQLVFAGSVAAVVAAS